MPSNSTLPEKDNSATRKPKQKDPLHWLLRSVLWAVGVLLAGAFSLLMVIAIGLAVAVPAVLGFNWLVRRNKSAMAQVHAFAADLEKYLLGGSKPKGQS